MCRQCYALQAQRGQCGGRKLKLYSSPETHNQLEGTPAPAHRHSVLSAPVQPHQQWNSVSASPHCFFCFVLFFTFCTLFVICVSERWQIFWKTPQHTRYSETVSSVYIWTSRYRRFWKEWRGHVLISWSCLIYLAWEYVLSYCGLCTVTEWMSYCLYWTKTCCLSSSWGLIDNVVSLLWQMYLS